MISIPEIFSVCGFEFKRSLTLGRLLAFAVLSLFPPAMILLISRVAPPTSFKFLIMFLTYVVCVLSLLLWATPNVYAELESRNWLFVTSRPRGRVSLLLGKYLASAISAFLVCLIAISLSSLIIALSYGRYRPDTLGELAHFWPRLILIAGIGCFDYAAVFSFFGVLFQRRAMVMAVLYTLVVELLFAAVPALITRFSIRYHLMGISYALLGWFAPGPEPDKELFELFYANLPVWANVLILALIPVGVLSAAIYVIRNREYLTVDEV